MGTWLKVMVTRSLGTYCLPWNEEGVPMSHLKDPLGTIPCIPPQELQTQENPQPIWLSATVFALGLKMKMEMKAGL